MIGHLEGTVLAPDVEYAIVSVGGVGYKVFMTPNDIRPLKKGAPISLWTHLSVRETAQDLFGFTNKDTLRFFELLLSVSGIGPRSALAILSIADIETLRTAITQNNPSYLTKVSGVGKKTAEKIVLELAEKVEAGSTSELKGALREHEDALEALRSMGYSANEAREALKSVPAGVTTSSERLREALRTLGGRTN
jgi:Holliday junction DNA helicase RuvA